jgi:hypothetical protein
VLALGYNTYGTFTGNSSNPPPCATSWDTTNVWKTPPEGVNEGYLILHWQ